MRLTEKPEQDIETFGNKLAKMACRISGTGSSPIDLSTLFATAFIYFNILLFQMKTSGLHDLVEINPKALSVDLIVCILKTKLRSLKTKVLWGTSEGNKLDMADELDGLKMAINNLAV